MLDKLQKQVRGTVITTLHASHESLAHRQNLASLKMNSLYSWEIFKLF